MPSPNPNLPPLLDKNDVGWLLRCSPRAVLDRHEKGQLPPTVTVPGDRRLLWSSSDFLTWVADEILGAGEVGVLPEGHGTEVISRMPDGMVGVGHRVVVADADTDDAR